MVQEAEEGKERPSSVTTETDRANFHYNFDAKKPTLVKGVSKAVFERVEQELITESLILLMPVRLKQSGIYE